MNSHTFLANKVICMCEENAPDGWPLVLRKLGLSLLSIEPSIGNGDAVTPDLVLVSERHRLVLVIECKSGANIKREQDDRYSRLDLKRLIRHLELKGTWSRHVVAYAINEEHEDRVGEHTNHSLIIFGRDSIRGVGDLGAAGITRALEAGIRLDQRAHVDTSHYPFSLDDSHDHVDMHVARAIGAYVDAHPEAETTNLANYDVADEVLRRTHKAHIRLAPKYRRKLVDLVVASIKRIQSGSSAASAGTRA